MIPRLYPAMGEIQFQAMRWFISFPGIVEYPVRIKLYLERTSGDFFRPTYRAHPLRIAARAACIVASRTNDPLGMSSYSPVNTGSMPRVPGLDWRSFRKGSLPLIGCLLSAGRRESTDSLCAPLRGC